ncbi:unnamed protein product [Brassica rapa]|uniref:Uncharacterized protein n=1 Tax=Brassica campestris TaxID=3711 RepID=A0A3P6AG16_BRACM|nr:unnamed protein product [Brassica rapa]VDC83258.1 unnamed protein product [Brassica rapa]
MCVPLRERPLSITIIVRSDTRTVLYFLKPHIHIGSNYEDQFKKLVLTTMIQAANSSRYFCTRNAKWKEYVNLYVLVQCTPVLTKNHQQNAFKKNWSKTFYSLAVILGTNFINLNNRKRKRFKE